MVDSIPWFFRVSSDTHHRSQPLGMKRREYWHVESMNRWVGFIRHPQKSKRSVQRKLHPPAPGHDLPDPLEDRTLHQTGFKAACVGHEPLKNGILHQDWTSFFWSLASDEASLCLEQLSEKAGAVISRATQRRAEMRNINCSIGGQLWREIASSCDSSRQWCRQSGLVVLHSWQHPGWIWPVYDLGVADAHPCWRWRRRRTWCARNSQASSTNCCGSVTSGCKKEWTLRALILREFVASPSSSGNKSRSRLASWIILICWVDGTQSTSLGLLLNGLLILQWKHWQGFKTSFRYGLRFYRTHQPVFLVMSWCTSCAAKAGWCFSSSSNANHIFSTSLRWPIVDYWK